MLLARILLPLKMSQKMEAGEKFVLLDADVIIHLFKAGKLSILQLLFPNRILILDIVYSELGNNRFVRNYIDNLITFKQAKILDFPTDNKEMFSEYSSLRNRKGKGESACLAVCRYQKNILASSNLADTKEYCEEYSIDYITTLDLLAIASIKGVISQTEADQGIADIKSKGSILPKQFTTIASYIESGFERKKLMY